ncbi:MAG TPA: hypothetical protein VMU84_07370 [Thermoanaerobaculia bacterium]|nr:hypothetical protein [Thermoanaerobaculia bacterium]
MTDMLDVAIGLVFLYLLMSLVCSAAAEIFEGFLKYRARDLERGVRELLHDPKLVQELYDHPLIRGLYKSRYNPRRKGALPAYIPAKTFALALLDIVPAGGPQAKSAGPMPDLPEVKLGSRIINWFREAKRAFLDEIPEESNVDLRARVQHALEVLARDAGDDAKKTRENVENWFNSAMDRVSGWYKRRTQTVLLVIGLGASLWMNIDSIYIAKTLATNKALRDSTVAAATEYAKADAEQQTKEAHERFKEAEATLQGLGLPIGWTKNSYGCPTCDHAEVSRWQRIRDICWVRCWAVKLLGILITACAISLGSPFWFDLLNKFMVVRSTIKPAEKSGQEAAKEPQAPQQ